MSNQANHVSSRQDVYSEITSQLIAAIEADPGKPELPWRKSSGALFMPVNALTQNAYNGINIVSLWVAAEAKGFAAPLWATYRQWLELGAQVRAGEKSSPVIFFKEFEAEPDPGNAEDDGKRRVARASRVFNAAEVDGYALPAQPDPLGPVERIAGADLFVSATGARIEHGGDRAFYRPSTDHIQMPAEEAFCGSETMSRSEGYYATLVHELTHNADTWIMPLRCYRSRLRSRKEAPSVGIIPRALSDYRFGLRGEGSQLRHLPRCRHQRCLYVSIEIGFTGQKNFQDA
jgi:antirestriction protein ArdC